MAGEFISSGLKWCGDTESQSICTCRYATCNALNVLTLDPWLKPVGDILRSNSAMLLYLQNVLIFNLGGLFMIFLPENFLKTASFYLVVIGQDM